MTPLQVQKGHEMADTIMAGIREVEMARVAGKELPEAESLFDELDSED